MGLTASITMKFVIQLTNVQVVIQYLNLDGGFGSLLLTF